jgi:hypothetical protein
MESANIGQQRPLKPSLMAENVYDDMIVVNEHHVENSDQPLLSGDISMTLPLRYVQ